MADQRWLQKGTTTWHEYGLGAALILAVLEGSIYIHHEDFGGAIGIILIPGLLWIGFYWQHSWRRRPKPLSWAATLLGATAWLFALGLIFQHR